jgi:hypothetical protein
MGYAKFLLVPSLMFARKAMSQPKWKSQMLHLGLEKLGKDKHSSFFRLFVNDEENKFYYINPKCQLKKIP